METTIVWCLRRATIPGALLVATVAVIRPLTAQEPLIFDASRVRVADHTYPLFPEQDGRQTARPAPDVRVDFDVPAAVLENLSARVEQGWAPGFVIGVIDRRGPRVYSLGSTAYGMATPPDGKTLYEIGSVTKALAGVLLAELASRGDVSLTAPVGTLVPQLRGTAAGNLTLAQLAAHRSGLPRDPADLTVQESTENPFARYDRARLWAAAVRATPVFTPGTSYLYSNFGFGVLGEALSTHAATTFDALLRKFVLAPLGMRNTFIDVPPDAQFRLAPAYRDRQHVSSWDFAALHATGALRSCVDDLLRLVGSAAGLLPSSVETAFRVAETPPPTGAGGERGGNVGLGWHLIQANGRRVVWHDGRTGGYRSLVGYDRAAGFGIVILTNSTESLDDVAAHLLDQRAPLAPVPPRRSLARTQADAFGGDYVMAPGFSLHVRPAEDHLSVRGTGQAALAAWWQDGDEFFYRTVDARLRFDRDSSGVVTGVWLMQGGITRRGTRARSERTLRLTTADGGIVVADQYGSGAHGVVLVHGGRFTRSSWRPLAMRLAAESLQVVAIDLRGYGESPLGRPPEIGQREEVEDVRAAVRWLRANGASEISLIGASLGGAAVAAATVDTTSPIDVARLVLLAPSRLASPERVTVPTLIVIGARDTTASGALRLTETWAQYRRLAGMKVLRTIDTDAHAQELLDRAGADDVVTELRNFLRRTRRPL